MRDIIETAAICTACAAFAGAFLGAVGFVASEIIAPAFGLPGGQASAIGIVAGLFS